VRDGNDEDGEDDDDEEEEKVAAVLVLEGVLGMESRQLMRSSRGTRWRMPDHQIERESRT
jgi:hypothetical protein